MIRVRPVGRLALFLALGGTSPCHAATEEAKAPDYLEWRLLNRNYFLYNDYRRADAGRGYRKEWAHGLIADLESAYTPRPRRFRPRSPRLRRLQARRRTWPCRHRPVAAGLIRR